MQNSTIIRMKKINQDKLTSNICKHAEEYCAELWTKLHHLQHCLWSSFWLQSQLQSSPSTNLLYTPPEAATNKWSIMQFVGRIAMPHLRYQCLLVSLKIMQNHNRVVVNSSPRSVKSELRQKSELGHDRLSNDTHKCYRRYWSLMLKVSAISITIQFPKFIGDIFTDTV